MKEYYTNSEIKKFYLKRWAALNVKILRINEVIINTTNNDTAHYLRTYKDELFKIKQSEKLEVKKL